MGDSEKTSGTALRARGRNIERDRVYLIPDGQEQFGKCCVGSRELPKVVRQAEAVIWVFAGNLCPPLPIPLRNHHDSQSEASRASHPHA